MTESSRTKFLAPERLEHAATLVAEMASRQNVLVLLIGGYAMQFYGSNRLTGDVDFAAHSALRGLPKGKPLVFGGKQTKSPDGVPLDLVVRSDDYKSLYSAAVWYPRFFDTLPGVPVVKPEFLAAMKLAAGRPKDLGDLDALILSGRLDIQATSALVKKHLGAYAAKNFDQIAAVAKWQKRTRRT